MLSVGVILLYLFTGGILALAVGLVLLWRYRRSIDRLMRATLQSDGGTRTKAVSAAPTATTELKVERVVPAHGGARAGVTETPIWRGGTAYLLGGWAHAAVATLLFALFAIYFVSACCCYLLLCCF
jgi:hypothetical protein